MKKVLFGLVFLGSCFWFLGVLDIFQKEARKVSQEIVQNTYMGPTSPVPGNPLLIKVELLIKDSPKAAGPQIEKVTFNGQDIPLKPRDIFGNRGMASFQLPPGNYTLRWTVNLDKVVWPRSGSYEEEVMLSPRDLWVQITVEGEHASIL